MLNQVDRLGNISDWNPPYDLSDDSDKAVLIREALAFNKDVLHLDEIIPLSVSPDREQYNVDTLRQMLKDKYGQALNVQLNRRRRETSGFSASREWKRARQAAGSLFTLITKDREK